jgi:riboflavin kinase/FMN adenylyltransferase
MKIINFKDFKSEDFFDCEIVCAIGNFDGFHLGHKKILNEMHEFSKSLKNPKLTLISFQPNTRFFFSPKENFLLNDYEEKILLAKSFGIEILIEINFDDEFRLLEPENFIEQILIKKFKIKALFVGEDFKFGKDKGANIDFFLKYETKFKFFKINVEHKKDSSLILEKDFSSSEIRNLISKGDIKSANHYLGYNFFISGIVFEGFKRGRMIGFPTANVQIQKGKIFPKFGVYLTSVMIFNNDDDFEKNFEDIVFNKVKCLKSISNFGVKPTFGDDLRPILETHILDFHEEIYGKKLFIFLHEFIREEKKFNSIDELKIQIKKDLLRI